MSRRANVYIDGFNFYYGLVRGSAYKWLDLERYFTRLRQADDIQTIHYFTALVRNEPQQSRQLAYLRALATLPKLNVVEGRFKFKDVRCGVQTCTHNGPRVFRVPEEKRTDVNIALQIVQDAYEDACDIFVLVSGDSDLAPALETVRSKFPEKEIVVYVPSRVAVRSYAVELRSAAHKHRTLPDALLRHSLLPGSVPDGSGGFIQKPGTW
ncbi:MAG: NYN domain-containing protein [Bryobacterales bacterium]|nr:NYN domain-containing protein [Acidobacteriota bacterium]MCB9384197.1 NYN domain-containing protein [Bryobacterales bacterium]